MEVMEETAMARIAYWVTTVIIAAELAVGGVWDVLRVPFVRGVMEHLGYPSYLLVILGAFKLPGALALVVPRFPRVKEWAYAGAFFNYAGAAASHAIAGDGAAGWAGPAAFAAILAASWALRPPGRRLSDAAPATAVTIAR